MDQKLQAHKEYLQQTYPQQCGTENVVRDKSAVEVEIDRLDCLVNRISHTEYMIGEKLSAVLRPDVNGISGAPSGVNVRVMSPLVESLQQKIDRIGESIERINNLLDRLDI